MSNGAKGEHPPPPSASLGMTQENQGTWDRCVERPLLLTTRTASAVLTAHNKKMNNEEA